MFQHNRSSSITILRKSKHVYISRYSSYLVVFVLAWTGAVVQMSEAAVSKCSAKQMLLKISQNSQEITGAGVSL